MAKNGNIQKSGTLEDLRNEFSTIQAQVAALGRKLDALAQSPEETASAPAPRKIKRPAASRPSGGRGEVTIQGPRGADARALMQKEGLLVLKGSQVSDDVVPSMPAALQTARQSLVDGKVITRAGKGWRFAQDHLFPSVSTAAAVVMGRNANGWREWKDGQGRTLGQLHRK